MVHDFSSRGPRDTRKTLVCGARLHSIPGSILVMLLIGVLLSGCGARGGKGSDAHAGTPSQGAATPAELYTKLYAAVSEHSLKAFNTIATDHVWMDHSDNPITKEKYFDWLSGNGRPKISLPEKPFAVATSLADFADESGYDEASLTEEADDGGVNPNAMGGVVLRKAQPDEEFGAEDVMIAFIRVDGHWLVWGSKV